MKQYKLIKEYPGSPKLGFEVNFGNSSVTYNRNTYPFTFYLDIISTFNEFWQEIIEKDYEILSIRSKINSRKPIPWCNGKNPMTGADYIENNSNAEIFSVKRLSDGEIFTIGDYAKYLPKHGEKQIISFHLDGSKELYIQLTNNECYLDSLIKVKQPLN